MAALLRAPKECGSWFWGLEEVAAPGLEWALATAARMAGVLERFELLSPVRLEYDWYVFGEGFTGVTSTVALTTSLADPDLADRLRGTRPVAFPTADIDDVHVVGAGAWFDATGGRRRESRLIELSVSPLPIGLSAELCVHHDIWNWFDFSGHPHPEIYNANAPRLALALAELNSLLGVVAEPGEPTCFGAATHDGVAIPEADEDGLGPDLTDLL
ncbi:hypothetical protein GCM10018785_25110 [Streptomyces longispororuber]|uniref:Uncharacterized protein n=1 Tax=Streptomyces longispororuber TaxID=68230 RepID=A0A918ZIH1_9ACTN|nr:hypothetical protein [Streptomyces longispororuber]GHE54669.1 hypothetical protein GCM10018785_25110 [Streptomyces longispororuber]